MRTSHEASRRITVALESLGAVLAKLPGETQVGILALNSRVGGSPWIVPVEPLENGRWKQSLSRITARGGTPLGAAVKTGADRLLELRGKEPGGFFRLLVVTDGEANDQDLLESYIPDLISRGISLDVIGVDMRDAHSLAKHAHSYRRAADRGTLEQALSEALAETTADDAASQADFEMLAGLPDDAAAELLKSISTPRNDPIHPINEFVVPIGVEHPINQPGMPVGNNPAQTNAAQANPPPSSGGSVLGSLCCFGCTGCLMLLIVLAASAAKMASQKLGG